MAYIILFIGALLTLILYLLRLLLRLLLGLLCFPFYLPFYLIIYSFKVFFKDEDVYIKRNNLTKSIGRIPARILYAYFFSTIIGPCIVAMLAGIVYGIIMGIKFLFNL